MPVCRGVIEMFVDTSGADLGAVRTGSLASGFTGLTPGDFVMFYWNSNTTGDWNNPSPGATIETGPNGAAGNIPETVLLSREFALSTAEIAANQVQQWFPSNFHPHTIYMGIWGDVDLKTPVNVVGNYTNAADPGVGSVSPVTMPFKDITPTIYGDYLVGIIGIGAGQTPTSWGTDPAGFSRLVASTSKNGCYFMGQAQTTPTALGTKTIVCTGPSAIGSNATSVSLRPNISAFKEVEYVGTGALAASATNGGSVTPGTISGQLAGDFLVVVLWGRPTGTTEPATPSGWFKDQTVLQEIGTNDLRITTYYKPMAASSTDVPTFTVPDAAWGGGTTAGMYAFQMAFRNVDPSNPFDITSVTSSGAAAASFTPTGGVTVKDKVWALSCVATGDDNTLTIPAGTSAAQGFKALASGASYQSTTGSDAAGGAAFRCIRAGGTTVTCPTWTETANGNDAWAAITMFLRPVGRPRAQDPYVPPQAMQRSSRW